MVYQFKDGFRLGSDAQGAGEALEGLRAKHGGRLTAVQIAKAARPKRSPLHGYFEWDDTEAAAKYRLQQAGYLVRAIVVIAEEHEEHFEPVRAFVSVSDEDGDSDRAFVHIKVAMGDPDLQAEVLSDAKAELAAWRKRYKDLVAFAELFTMIDAMVT